MREFFFVCEHMTIEFRVDWLLEKEVFCPGAQHMGI